MIFVVDAANRDCFAVDLAAMHRQRKAAFVDCARWRIPAVGDQESDQYDTMADTMYLLVKAAPQGPLLASARLLTTTGPHLMRDLYSASYRAALPSGPSVWEISRYCTAPGIGSRTKRLSLLWEIIAGVMETALQRGIDRLIFAANRSLLPLALDSGWDARTVGPTMSDGEDEVTAVVATVTPNGLQTVRDRHAISEQVFHHRHTPTARTDQPPQAQHGRNRAACDAGPCKCQED